MLDKCLITLALLFISFSSGLHAQYKEWNPANETINVIEGKGWHEHAVLYRRLPAKAQQLVREDVWDLSANTAGLQIHFKTDADEIIVKYKVTGGLQFPHMPATGVSGVDMYLKTKRNEWLWAAGKYSFNDTIVYRFTTTAAAVKDAEYILYLPLYNTVEWMTISVPEKSVFKPLPVSKKKPIVVYGTSIAQGACATRPGIAWTALLERKLNTPVFNLGFSGNGRLEKSVIELISEIDAAVYLIDCLPNMVEGILTADEVKARVKDAVNILQSKHPATPILFCEHDGLTGGLVNIADERKYSSVNAALRQAFDSLKTAGIKNIYLLTKKEIGQNNETMVDGVHPNDIGMMLYANAYEKKIKAILQAKGRK